ncbi:GAF domain-containing protein, partial [Anaerolineae bacterium CFX9]|nr:GAF domain-containing protein [Anaerolineae bacterium CFX9]
LVKVARITVQWALENSSATAAALGVITGEAPNQRLEIVYQEGYDGDAPEGAEGKSWPLDRGIVSRVLRTRQADLTPDVTMDPDYVPSLKGAKSQITIPMLSGGAVNAMLIMETNREPRLRIADLPFLQRLCEHASIAISNAQLYTELNRANQSKSEFVSFVAHELKNPLTSIRGYSDFLLGNVVGQLNEQQRNFLATIRNNAERMNTLVSDLNDVTKLQTNNMRIDPSPMDFHRVVTETLRPLEKQIADKEQTLVLDMADDLPLVQGDENRLIQVLTNLVSNAHKYTPQKGTITISAAPDSEMRDRKGRQLPPLLHVRVTDTGIGMSQDDIDQLFTPYFRSQNPLAQEQLGTGLGLTITRGIIEQHHGEIWVESVLGEGTTFHFTIPLALQSEGQQG